MDVRGKVDISQANKRYRIIEDHEHFLNHHEKSLESTLKRVFFGIQLSSHKVNRQKFNYQFQLSKRIYLGPTSTDNDLAHMMCNQANIFEGATVVDPFVGTGGMLIPPASQGAFVFGCDLDMRVICGYSVGRINKKSPFYDPQKKLEIFTPKINLNFEQYKLPTPNIMRMDSTKQSYRGT